MKANEKIARFVSILDKLSQKGHNIPGLIMSSPGYGKTSTLEMFSKFKDYNLTTLIASQYAPDDILGLQAVNNGRLERLTPSWFNDMMELSKNGKRNILFIDEITTCDDFIQAPLMNLIFTRKLNNRVSLPENTVILAAGNYAEELNNSFKLSLPIVNRFLILNLKQSDYDFSEIFNHKFDTIRTSEEIEDYLGIKEIYKPHWSYSRIALFLKGIVGNDRLIGIQNSASTGLVGFTSVRSVDYSLKFLSEFCNSFDTDDWVQIIGDSLGVLGVEKISVLTRLTSALKSGRLVNDATEAPRTICDVIKEMESRAVCGLPIDGPVSALKSMTQNIEAITGDEMEALSNCNILDVREIFNEITRKLIKMS